MSSAAPLPSTQQAIVRYHQLSPSKGKIYAVRWVRPDGRVVLHRYYRRRPDAVAHAERLRSKGVTPAIYVSNTGWAEVTT